MKNLGKGLLALLVCVGITGCGESANNEKTISIGASVTPHAEILKFVKPELEGKGYKVEIVEFTDYIKPNEALVDGTLDANFFQHKPYLDEWSKSNDASALLTSVFNVHFEPLGIYSTKNTKIDFIDTANQIKVAIPNDPTNGGRALQLLAVNGFIEVDASKGISVTKNDIVNTKGIEIIEMSAESCANNIADVDYAVINGNNALNAKIADKVLAQEAKDSEAAKQFANIIAVKVKDKDSQKIKDLLAVLNSEKVKTYIDDTFEGIVVPLVPSN